MNFVDIVASVNAWTHTDALVRSGQIAHNVALATRAVHACAKFPQDLVTRVIALPSPGTSVSLSITDNLPNARGLFSVVRGYNLQTNSVGKKYRQSTADTLFPDNESDALPTNIYYVAGSSLNIYAVEAISGLLVSYYAAPTVEPYSQYTSWIANEYPEPIILLAARNTAMQTRDAALGNTLAALYADAKTTLITNYFVPGE